MTSSHHHQLPVFFSKLISESPCITNKEQQPSLKYKIKAAPWKKNDSYAITNRHCKWDD
jgi:hypothetical protein